MYPYSHDFYFYSLYKFVNKIQYNTRYLVLFLVITQNTVSCLASTSIYVKRIQNQITSNNVVSRFTPVSKFQPTMDRNLPKSWL